MAPDEAYRALDSYIPINIEQLPQELVNHAARRCQFAEHRAQAAADEARWKTAVKRVRSQKFMILRTEGLKNPDGSVRKLTEAETNAMIDLDPEVMAVEAYYWDVIQKKTYLEEMHDIWNDRHTMLANLSKHFLEREESGRTKGGY